MAFELPDADFAGQLGGGGRVALQGEGTVQGLPVAAPHSGEGNFLQWGRVDRRGGEEQSPASRNQNRRDLVTTIMMMMVIIAQIIA